MERHELHEGLAWTALFFNLSFEGRNKEMDREKGNKKYEKKKTMFER